MIQSSIGFTIRLAYKGDMVLEETDCKVATGQERVNRLALLYWLLTHYEENLKEVDHDIKSLEMNSWYSPNGRTDCGSTACAAGTAMLHPSFNKMGLVPYNSSWLANGPAYGNLDGFRALEAFFGITDLEAETIFDPSYYGNEDRDRPESVASRVSKLIEQYRMQDEIDYPSEIILTGSLSVEEVVQTTVINQVWP